MVPPERPRPLETALFPPRRRRVLDALSGFGVSQLAAKILLLKLIGLTVLLFATLYLLDLRSRIADVMMQSLLVQTDAVLGVLASARWDRQSDSVRPLRRGDAGAGVEGIGGGVRPGSAADGFDRRASADLLRSVVGGSLTRARLYGLDGQEIADSQPAAAGGTGAGVPALDEPLTSLHAQVWRYFAGLVSAPSLPPAPREEETAAPPEVAAALEGVRTALERRREGGDIVLSVAAPVYSEGGKVLAALRLTSAPGAVSEAARDQELAVLKGFAVAAVVATVLSLFMAARITRPLRRLAQAAERVKAGGAAAPIPELRECGEIGALSRVLHDMTTALYSRIDAMEAFAGEVAHEIKSPLTSLRSAVETLPLARTERARTQLLEVIHHDVRRIDRLISDIADASKLDAELNRHRHRRVDLLAVLRSVVDAQHELALGRGQRIGLFVRNPGNVFAVFGNDGRLGQVFTNLLDNARSFTGEGGCVNIAIERFANFIEVIVDDEGPGIEEAVLERIFERFYTDRFEQQSFGNNSGLGLSISRQIVEAHGGEIFAENRYRTTLGPLRTAAGARFVVRLPAA